MKNDQRRAFSWFVNIENHTKYTLSWFVNNEKRFRTYVQFHNYEITRVEPLGKRHLRMLKCDLQQPIRLATLRFLFKMQWRRQTFNSWGGAVGGKIILGSRMLVRESEDPFFWSHGLFWGQKQHQKIHF